MAITKALIIPCLNEQAALPVLFTQLRERLPDWQVYVFDNASDDDTAIVAAQLGATVYRVPERGKGNVVCRMFADVEADVYLMIDGDGTYDLTFAEGHAEELLAGKIDMIIGSRIASYQESASRRGHQFGNHLLTSLLNRLFHMRFTDVLSGYRMMSRRFVKSAPILAAGFEVEVMLTVHALEVKSHVQERIVGYGKRANGTQSKLRTITDGTRILRTLIFLFKEVRPLAFFLGCAAILALLSLIFGIPVIDEYLTTGLVPRIPTAILAASLMLSAIISITCGLILDSVALQRRELKRALYQGYV